MELLEQVGLKSELHKRPSQLSGGQQQRVAIARALVNTPRVIPVDEPTGNLDICSGREILQLLKSIHDGGTTMVLATHDAEIARQANRIVTISDGRITGFNDPSP